MPTAPITLAQLCVYPLKSARGFRPDAWPVEASGLHLDRRWMLVDGEGRSMSQRTTARLALVEASLVDGALHVSAPGMPTSPPLPLAAGDDRETRTEVAMDGGERLVTASVSAELDDWFSTALGMTCRLVNNEGHRERWVDGRPPAVGPGDGPVAHPMNYHNAFPLHLVSRSSLDDLNARLETPVRMDRFRPNLVVTGTAPHEDDGWTRLAIGDVRLRIVRPCDHRCGMPNVDQQTGTWGKQPLKTLATYRLTERGIEFGQNVVVERPGELRVGEAVEVLEG